MFLAFILIQFDYISNKPQIRQYCRDTTNFINLNQQSLSQIFGNIFDEAKTCTDEKCKSKVSDFIMHSLVGKEELTFFPSTYFIRVSNERKIEKLFLGGDYKEKSAETRKEYEVVRLLEGRRNKICDQGWKLDNVTSYMKYLYDFPSEAEIIIPVKENGRVIGAIVKTWGD